MKNATQHNSFGKSKERQERRSRLHRGEAAGNSRGIVLFYHTRNDENFILEESQIVLLLLLDITLVCIKPDTILHNSLCKRVVVIQKNNNVKL